MLCIHHSSFKLRSIFEHLPASPLPSKKMKYAKEPAPSDFICSVTADLLLQPHLTLCCGQHLSPEAVTTMVEDGMPCPLCKTASWSTVLNKHFQRQVKDRYWRPIKKFIDYFFLSHYPDSHMICLLVQHLYQKIHIHFSSSHLMTSSVQWMAVSSSSLASLPAVPDTSHLKLLPG